jgi:hypothetical protein
LCPPYSRIANSPSDQCPSNKRTTAVLLQWQHRWKCRKTSSTFGAPGRGHISPFLVFQASSPWCFPGSKASTTPSRRPRDDVAATQPEARGGCYSATASTSPRSHVGSLPWASSCSRIYLVLDLCFLFVFASGFLPQFLVRFFLPSLCLKGLVCVKLFAKLGCCRTLCLFP